MTRRQHLLFRTLSSVGTGGFVMLAGVVMAGSGVMGTRLTVATAGVIAVCAFWLTGRVRARGDALEAAARPFGLEAAALDRGVLDGLSGLRLRQLRRTHELEIRRVLRGQRHGVQVAVVDVTLRLRGDGNRDGRMTLLIARVPARTPYCSVQVRHPEAWDPWHAGLLGLEEIPVGHQKFDAAYQVLGTSPSAVRTLLGREVRDVLLGMPTGCLVEVWGDVVLVDGGDVPASQLPAHLDLVTRIARGLPATLADQAA